MSDDMDIIRGGGNVFRDLGYPDADREHLRAALAAQTIGVLDDRKLKVRAAHELTGIAAADCCPSNRTTRLIDQIENS